MRVLLTVSGWSAHFFPIVPLGWALRAAGHDVQVSCGPGLAGAVRGAGLIPVDVAGDVDMVLLARFGALFGFGHREGGHREGARDIPRLHPVTGAELAPDERFDVHEFKARWVAPQFAELRRGIDRVVEFARDWRPDLVVSDLACCDGVIAARAVGVPAVWNLWGPIGPVETDPGLDFFRMFFGPELVRRGLPADGELAAAVIDPSPRSLEPRIEGRRLPVRYVPYNGPGLPPAGLPRPRRRRVCVAWGTSITPIFGRASFLVPRVLSALAGFDVEVVVAVSESDRELLGDLPEQVVACGRLPLHRVLGDCDLIVHHGGAGTLMTALQFGLPQLSVSFAPEQDAEGLRLASTGAGRHLWGRSVTDADLHESLAALLDDPAYRSAAGRLRTESFARPVPADLVTPLVELARRPAPVG
jgi:UDP:flavonoid glycosyltransferase YjiC (YdhE family)